MRFRLEDRAGKTTWEGIVAGDAHQWGRSFEQDVLTQSDVFRLTASVQSRDPKRNESLDGPRKVRRRGEP